GRLDRCRPGPGPRADRGRRRQAGTSAAPPGRVPGLPRLVGDRQTALVRPRTALIARLRSSRAVLSVVRGVVAWLVRRTSAAVESFLFDEFLEFGLEVAHLVGEDPPSHRPEAEGHLQQVADDERADEVGDVLDQEADLGLTQAEDVAGYPQRDVAEHH